MVLLWLTVLSSIRLSWATRGVLVSWVEMGFVVVDLEEEGVVASSCDVLDADAIDDKPIPFRESVRSDTLGRQASTLNRRSTLSPANF